MGNIDGCAEQYIYATALYLISVLSQRHSILFDQGISATERGEEVVGGINVIDKQYMYQLMSPVQLNG